MNTGLQSADTPSHSIARSWIHRLRAAVAIGALGVMMLPTKGWADPQTRDGFFIGLGLGTGSAGQGSFGASGNRESGSGVGFRLGWTLNPRVAIGIENGSWFKSDEQGSTTLAITTAAVSIFPVEGLVLRGGVGAGAEKGVGDGGDFGMSWTIGTAYEFRIARSFAIGPQIDYSRIDLPYYDDSINYYLIGLSTNWYFIPK